MAAELGAGKIRIGAQPPHSQREIAQHMPTAYSSSIKAHPRRHKSSSRFNHLTQLRSDRPPTTSKREIHFYALLKRNSNLVSEKTDSLTRWRRVQLTFMEDKHTAFMRQAIELSQISVASGGGPFGALIVRDDTVVAKGQNRVVTKNDPTAHAEIEAIRAACQKLGTHNLAGCSIYSSCEPCPMCLAAIYWTHLDALWYGASKHDASQAGFDDRRLYRELSLAENERTLITSQLLEEDAQCAFDEWGAKRDKTPY